VNVEIGYAEAALAGGSTIEIELSDGTVLTVAAAAATLALSGSTKLPARFWTAA
jgi:hypothetical protein